MDLKLESPQIILQEEFNRRKRINDRYSLRMLARKLDLPPGRVSELLSGKRKMTQKTAEKIANRLGYDPDQRKQLFDALKYSNGNFELEESIEENDFKPLDSDSFYVIADWYHFAILSLMELDDFDSTEKWIADRLGISIVQVKSALQRLQRLGLIATNHDGKWVQQQENTTTTHDLESVALKMSHKQSLEQAIDAIDNISVDLRDITSMTMAIDLERLPKAKLLIKNFRRQLCAFLEGTPQKNEVYNLNIQLIPVTKPQQERNKK